MATMQKIPPNRKTLFSASGFTGRPRQIRRLQSRDQTGECMFNLFLLCLLLQPVF
jgi:hypothetical protein